MTDKPVKSTSENEGVRGTARRVDWQDLWAILFEDPDRSPQLFTAEGPARETLAKESLNWACHLFRKVDDEACAYSELVAALHMALPLLEMRPREIRLYNHQELDDAINAAGAALAKALPREVKP